MSGFLNVGVIGCGNISSTYFRLSNLFKTIEVHACADLNPVTAREQAEQFGLEALSVEDLLASNLDIIINLTVPSAHFEVSKAILESGKHLYSEKPLTLSLADSITLRDLAQKKGLHVACSPDTVKSWGEPGIFLAMAWRTGIQIRVSFSSPGEARYWILDLTTSRI